MKQTIVFETERVSDVFRGLVIDMRTFDVVGRTGLYASAADARAAAVSMWRARNKVAAVSAAA